MKRVALVTCKKLPEPDPDEALLLDALARESLRAEMLAWDDDAGDPSRYDLCVFRSCWNYYKDIRSFLAWIDRASTVSHLVNPRTIVEWNLHKSYLRELEQAGIEIVPTAWIARGQSIDLHSLMRQRRWNEVVIKPAVSAASFRTKRFGADDVDAAQRFLDGLAKDRDTLVQEYMRAVESGGERALVWIDGELTHAVGKHPRFSGEHERVTQALPLTTADRHTANATLACVDGTPLYARIDVVADSRGHRWVSELELIEPSLFLLQHPPALRRLAKGIEQWLDKCL